MVETLSVESGCTNSTLTGLATFSGLAKILSFRAAICFLSCRRVRSLVYVIVESDI